MFDLEKALATWRRPYEHLRALSHEDLRELEGHLRDEVEALIEEGATPEQAFRRAVREMDTHAALAQEYGKVYWQKIHHQGRLGEALQHHGSMLHNYFRVAFRHLTRHKGYTFINIVGLAVGIAGCLLILLFVRGELSYDTFHTEKDRLYRVVSEGAYGRSASMSPQFGPVLTEALPQVEAAIRFHRRDGLLVRNPTWSAEEVGAYEDGFVYADSLFFEAFSFELLHGDPATVLDEPYAVVLTETMAKKYFGTQDPLGQVLQVNNEHFFTVTGIVKGSPASALAFNFLASFATLRVHPFEAPMFHSGWSVTAYPTYLLLAPGTPPQEIAAQAVTALRQHTDKSHILDPTYKLEPVTAVHFSQATGGVNPSSDVRYVYIFGSIALLILCIAGINYINLTTARAVQRAREVGVRKVVGAHRWHLARQFLGESVLTSLLALVLALVLVYLALPVFSDLVGQDIRLDPSQGGLYAVVLLGLVFVIGVLAGSYPALLLSGLQPVAVLKGRIGRLGSAASLRKGLVVVQFTISLFLIVSTLIIQQQLGFVQEKRLGLEEEHVVAIELRGPMQARAAQLAEQLQAQPYVASAAAAGAMPTHGGTQFGVKVGEETVYLRVYPVTPAYLNTLGLTLKEGRNFSTERDDTSGKVRLGGALVNEAYVRAFGKDAVLGAEIPRAFNSNRYRIIGVVEDFHHASLHEAITPAVLVPIEDFWSWYVAVKLRPDGMPDALASLAQIWKQQGSIYPFEYFFLDQAFDRLYQAEDQLGRIFGAFALMAIVIACLGLFGLAAFTTAQRTQEIGVRKVLGASALGIMALLSKDFLKLVVWAFVLAAPGAYLVMARWLERFAYRTEVGGTLFLGAGLLALTIALLTVSYQALRAAQANPVEALRYE